MTAYTREKMVAYAREWRAKNPGYHKKWRQKNPGRVVQYGWKKKGLPSPTRQRPETCELCGKPPNIKRSLALDHCHETGAFRGWLCYRCNLGLGLLGDTAESLKRAIAYLGGAKFFKQP